MKNFKFLIIFFTIGLLFIVGCAKKNPLSPIAFSNSIGRLYESPQKSGNFVYVLNQPFSGDGYVSKINLDSNEVIKNYFSTGEVPNDILIRGWYAYIVNASSDNLQIHNLLTAKDEFINFNTYSSPEKMDLYNEKVFVSLWGANKIAVVDIKSKEITHTISITNVTSSPWGIKIANNYLFVACNGSYIAWNDPDNYTNGKIVVYNINDYSFVKIFNNITNAMNLTKDEAGNIYCVALGQYNNSAKVYKIDSSLNISTLCDTGLNTGGISYDKVNSMLFLSDASWTSTKGFYAISAGGGTPTSIFSGYNFNESTFFYKDTEYYGIVCNGDTAEARLFSPSTFSTITTFEVGANPVKAVYGKY